LGGGGNIFFQAFCYPILGATFLVGSWAQGLIWALGSKALRVFNLAFNLVGLPASLLAWIAFDGTPLDHQLDLALQTAGLTTWFSTGTSNARADRA